MNAGYKKNNFYDFFYSFGKLVAMEISFLQKK